MKNIRNIVIAIILGLAVVSPLNLTNSYLRCSEFETVVVKYGESVETIAGRYTENSEQAKELVEAIIEINDIKSARDMKAGRRLQVPVLAKDQDSLQVASR